MPKRLPISAAMNVLKKYDLSQVILVAYDKKTGLTHVVTAGKTLEDCDQAAQGGDFVKKALGWPESLKTLPSRVQKLKKEIKRLKSRISIFKEEN